MAAPFVVGVGGTTRIGSSSEKALRLALRAAERHGARTRLFAGTDLDFPSYDPARTVRCEAADTLVAALRAADGVIVATPSYHGSISGLVKNALDYTEDMRADPRPYLDGRAVGCIVCAEGPQAMGSTLLALRSIVHALRAWPTPFAAVISSVGKPFGPDGEPSDLPVARQLDLVAAQVVEFARLRAFYAEHHPQEPAGRREEAST